MIKRALARASTKCHLDKKVVQIDTPDVDISSLGQQIVYGQPLVRIREDLYRHAPYVYLQKVKTVL